MLRQMELPLTFILSPWPIALERAMGTPEEGRVRGAWRNTNNDVRYSWTYSRQERKGANSREAAFLTLARIVGMALAVLVQTREDESTWILEQRRW